MITYEQIKNDPDIRVYVSAADSSLAALGYTEHSFPHVTRVAAMAGYILETLGYSERDIELAKIAGFMHDIGNLVNRADHSQSGAIIAFRILNDLGMDAKEIAAIVAAIGNHDEDTGVPVSAIAAALILADKSDVRRSRVRNKKLVDRSDIHDSVNYSVTKSELIINESKTEITLKLEIDTEFSAVMDYFEIFLKRMIMCRKVSQTIGLQFKISINGQLLL